MRRYIAIQIVLLAACSLIGTMTDGDLAETLRSLKIELQDSLPRGPFDYDVVKWRKATSNGVEVKAADVPSDRIED